MDRQQRPEKQAHHAQRRAREQETTSDGKAGQHRATINSLREMTTADRGRAMFLTRFTRIPIEAVVYDGPRFEDGGNFPLAGVSEGSTSARSTTLGKCDEFFDARNLAEVDRSPRGGVRRPELRRARGRMG